MVVQVHLQSEERYEYNSIGRVLVCGSKGYGFKSHYSSVAVSSMVEHFFYTEGVIGSNPILLTRVARLGRKVLRIYLQWGLIPLVLKVMSMMEVGIDTSVMCHLGIDQLLDQSNGVKDISKVGFESCNPNLICIGLCI